MDEEFDTSIDTSSFDDVTPDTSDVGSFDDASDIVSVMDEAMDTSSFEVSEDLDTSFTDTSEDVASIMDDVPSDMDSIEELNIEDTPVETDDLPLETESEIENLMDDTEGISSEIGESELSDITGAEFAEELPEQTDIGDVLDEAATDIEPETTEMPESEFSELAEQDSSEIESLMDEAALDNTSEDAEIMNEGETYDIPHDEISDIQTDASENESSEIEDLMNETEPASDDIEESTMDEGETYDITHDEEISESLSETDDGSEISDLMDIEETSEITEEESLEAGADLPNDEVLVEDVGDNVPENEEIEQTDLDVNRGPDDFETSPETLENPSQYETVGEFAPSEPGNPEAWDMSDVPSFEEHMNEINSQTDAEIESSLELTLQYFSFKSISTASKNVTQYNDEYFTRFSYYNELRRISLGYVVGLDSNIISSENARKKVEKAYLQNTEYWLAYCISGVMLWANNEKEAAQRAMAKSLSINYFNSCLFYLLINLRFNRIDAAKNRDCAFLRRTQPLNSGEDDFEEETRNSLLKKYSDVLSCTMQIDPLHNHWWIEELNNEKLAKAIKKLSEEEIVVIELHVICEMTQAESASCLGITQLESYVDFESSTEIPDQILEAFIEKIVVHKDSFEWHLRIPTVNTRCEIGEEEGMTDEVETVIEFLEKEETPTSQKLLISEFTMTKDDALKYMYSIDTRKRVHRWKDFEVKLYA